MDGEPCTTYIGPDGSGHYVKWFITESNTGHAINLRSVLPLTKVIGLDAEELHRVFSDWNRGELDSYLIEITADIFTKIDEETGHPSWMSFWTRPGKGRANGRAKHP